LLNEQRFIKATGKQLDRNNVLQVAPSDGLPDRLFTQKTSFQV
jgi:hypothetical protein